MKVLYIHNEYARPSGEEHASGELVALLQEYGHEVRWFKRSSAEIANSRTGQIKSFFTGIYNPCTAKKLAKVLDEYKPDIVQVQNLYPLLSVSIFKPLKERNIPVVMRCPNYRLFCPNGLCLDNAGEICEHCWDKGKEWWCIKKNCEKSFLKSVGYAVRNYYARNSRKILNGVDVFIVQSEFQKYKFISQGIPEKKIGVVPGIAPDIQSVSSGQIGEWVSFVGRISSEKGIYEFIRAAKTLPHITFKVAGNLDIRFKMPANIPQNIDFLGFLSGDSLNDLYERSRIIVVPSKWYEGFPNVIIRGMLLQRPVITTSIGAMQSIIDNNGNGLLVPPSDSEALGEAINSIYLDIDKCIAFGKAGKEKAEKLYSRNKIYNTLISIYNQAIDINQLYHQV